jgi:putative transcriptional regulator
MVKGHLDNNLKKYRKKFKITQEQLALKVGIKKNYYSEIERGVYFPSTLLSLQISQAINQIVSEKFNSQYRTRIIVDDLFFVVDSE